MIKQLAKTSKLHKADLRSIKLLADRCAAHDGYKPKIYWHIVESRLTNEFNDFFYSLDGNLVGCLNMYAFETHEAEMSVFVHPNHRRKGIFRKLLQEVLLEFTQRRITNCVWACPQDSPINQAYLESIGPEFVLSQIEMILKEPAETRSLPPISLRLASMQDLVTLAQLGSVSFKSSFTDNLQRFSENMRDTHRKAWIISTSEQENIGKIHVRYDVNKSAFIHDLCITPEFRGRNLAMSMILQVVELLKKQGQRTIFLDVESHNEGAFKLYQRCGFVKTGAFDFWRVSVERMRGMVM